LSYTLRFSLFILFGWQVTVRCEQEKQSREKGTFLSLGGLHESNHLLGYLIVVLVPMECNKDEALRAKALAERKMLEKDFVGARKMINKAQKLSLELDNITQMLTVCEVHCAAGTKVAGEIDWYGVLQVPPFTADATLIKRQYRKLALLLHPDKNRFAGAEAAFKFVGEANTTLADSSKRCVYDMKRKGSVRVDATTAAGSPPAHHQSWRAGPVRPNTRPVHQQHQHQPSTSEGSQSQTYWSICLVCGMRCQNFGLYCANCKDKQGVPYGANQQSNGLYNDAGAPQNHRGQQASSYDTPGVPASFGVPYNFPGQASYYATQGVHPSFGAPHNFPGPCRGVAGGQQPSNCATPGVQAKPGTRKRMYNSPHQHRAPAAADAAQRQRLAEWLAQQQGRSALVDTAKVKQWLSGQQNTL
jgi:curved DNA-binding protein CbpA